jgi:hypothetical protein
MSPELTTEYNIENWLEATKNLNFTIYSIEGYNEVSNTLYFGDITSQKESYSQSDLERDLKKVSRKRETFFGDNIRDAIKIIKS